MCRNVWLDLLLSPGWWVHFFAITNQYHKRFFCIISDNQTIQIIILERTGKFPSKIWRQNCWRRKWKSLRYHRIASTMSSCTYRTHSFWMNRLINRLSCVRLDVRMVCPRNTAWKHLARDWVWWLLHPSKRYVIRNSLRFWVSYFAFKLIQISFSLLARNRLLVLCWTGVRGTKTSNRHGKKSRPSKMMLSRRYSYFYTRTMLVTIYSRNLTWIRYSRYAFYRSIRNFVAKGLPRVCCANVMSLPLKMVFACWKWTQPAFSRKRWPHRWATSRVPSIVTMSTLTTITNAYSTWSHHINPVKSCTNYWMMNV